MVAVVIKTKDEQQYRYLVNIEWNLYELLEYLKQKLELKENQMRLRKGNVNRNSVYIE